MARVLILAQDTIGTQMAGPGIRCWEMATVLARHHTVVLGAPNDVTVSAETFLVTSYRGKRTSDFVRGYDVLITQFVDPTTAYIARKNGTRLICDLYDPVLLEGLEIFKGHPLAVQQEHNQRFLNEIGISVRTADAFLCASEKQRDLWLGSLMALGRITPEAYADDSSLESLVAVVPFGVQSRPPEKTGDGFRMRFGINPTAKVVIWGGGIWNWFDPLSVIEAMRRIASRRSDIKLVFMGVKHPNPDIPEMEMAARAERLAKELGLFGETVFFNYEWVPYDERQNHFLEADIGISSHCRHLETRFAFRTRILDYLWSSLPMVVTEGDSMAELVLRERLGIVVPFEDPGAIAAAIETIADDDATRDMFRKNIAAVARAFQWDKVLAPLLAMVEADDKQRKLTSVELGTIARVFGARLRRYYAARGLAPTLSAVAKSAYTAGAKRLRG